MAQIRLFDQDPFLPCQRLGLPHRDVYPVLQRREVRAERTQTDGEARRTVTELDERVLVRGRVEPVPVLGLSVEEAVEFVL